MNWLWMTLIGGASGVLASMGMGGGFILLVYLSLFSELEQKTAQGVNLLFFIPIIVISVIIHLKNKLIDLRTAVICGSIGAVTALAGFWVAGVIGNEWLRKAFAIFIILAGMKDLFSKKEKKPNRRLG